MNYVRDESDHQKRRWIIKVRGKEAIAAFKLGHLKKIGSNLYGEISLPDYPTASKKGYLIRQLAKHISDIEERAWSIACGRPKSHHYKLARRST